MVLELTLVILDLHVFMLDLIFLLSDLLVETFNFDLELVRLLLVRQHLVDLLTDLYFEVVELLLFLVHGLVKPFIAFLQ